MGVSLVLGSCRCHANLICFSAREQETFAPGKKIRRLGGALEKTVGYGFRASHALFFAWFGTAHW